MINLKKLLQNALITISATISFGAFAEVQLTVGEGVSILAVNGVEAGSGKLFSSAVSAHLKEGINQVLVGYTAEVKAGDDTELETIQPTVLLFSTGNENLNVSAPEIKTLGALEKFEKNLNWNLTSSSGKPVAFEATLLKQEGFQLARDYERELEEFNRSGHEAALQKTMIIKPAATGTTAKKAVPSQNSLSREKQNMAMEMLIYWYNQADEKTRSSFKELINR